MRPRPVLCLTAHERRDVALAEEVARGRFTHVGETVELGTEPDWLGAELPADEEWRIDWVKFAYGLDLATAYEETGDPRFATAWERLVASYIRDVPPDHDPSEVTARRILNWIYAWQRFPDVTPELAARIERSLGEQARHVRANLTPERNHRTLELYALLLTALALPGLDTNRALLLFAVAELDENLATDFRPDGAHREASTHYHLIALRSFVGARENLRRHRLPLPVGYDAALSRACDFALHCRRPDGQIPMLSDSDAGDYAELLALAGEQLDRDDLRWAGSSGRRGAPPSRRHADFPHAGYHVQRGGWQATDAYLIFDCGPLGDGGHGHYDLLSFEAFAGGRPLVVDPGRFTYSEAPPNLRRWFRGTAAHNTVCVDGLDQTPYTRKRPEGPVAEGRFLGRGRSAGLDVLAGEARSPAYDAVHRRRVVLVRDRYWIVEDRLRAAGPHRYDLRFHLGPEAEGRTTLTDEGAVSAPGLALMILGAGTITLEAGWVAPEYGVRVPAPVVSAVADGVREATFVTLLAPGVPARVRRDGPRLRVGEDTIVLGDEPLEVALW
ncbi:MAG TPA: alginate lyase family protein [Solirubrobacteraceae bacterium]|nr:alginate lyase family protein [Solirubrobacteraceae bacterium]